MFKSGIHLCLQTAATEHAAHVEAKDKFLTQIKDLESWLEHAREETAADVASPVDKDGVDAQVRRCRALQEELQVRQASLDELRGECEALCQRESSPQARELRARLRDAQTEFARLASDVSKKSDQLKSVSRESERLSRSVNEQQREVGSLSDWLRRAQDSSEALLETVSPRGAPPASDDATPDADIARKLLDGIKQRFDSKPSSRDVSDDSDNDDDVMSKWRRLRRKVAEATERTRRLEEDVQRSRPPPYLPLSLDDVTANDSDDVTGAEMTSAERLAANVRRGLEQLRSCWSELQQQLSDSDERLAKVDEFQNLYQNSLQSISQWLDDIEQRLFSASNWQEATSDCLRQTQALQEELASLQREITSMNQASQQLLTEASVESRQLIKQTVEEINTRLRMLEEQVRAREVTLQEQHDQETGALERVHDVSRRMTGATSLNSCTFAKICI